MTAEQVPLYLGLAVSLAVLAASLWYLGGAQERRDDTDANPEPDDPLEALDAPAEFLSPAEDGRLRLEGLRGADRLALDELVHWSSRQQLSTLFRDEAPSGPGTNADKTGRPASPAPTDRPGGQREP